MCASLSVAPAAEKMLVAVFLSSSTAMTGMRSPPSGQRACRVSAYALALRERDVWPIGAETFDLLDPSTY